MGDVPVDVPVNVPVPHEVKEYVPIFVDAPYDVAIEIPYEVYETRDVTIQIPIEIPVPYIAEEEVEEILPAYNYEPYSHPQHFPAKRLSKEPLPKFFVPETLPNDPFDPKISKPAEEE